jgi:hypothetical protein
LEIVEVAAAAAASEVVAAEEVVVVLYTSAKRAQRIFHHQKHLTAYLEQEQEGRKSAEHDSAEHGPAVVVVPDQDTSDLLEDRSSVESEVSSHIDDSWGQEDETWTILVGPHSLSLL